MKNKLKKFGRSILSSVLCLAMLLTTLVFFDIGSVLSDAVVGVTSNTPTGEASNQVIFYVPEVIYLAPTTASTSSFQYELDVKLDSNNNYVPDGSYNAIGAKDSIYFSYAYASNITLSYAWYSGSSGTLTINGLTTSSSGSSLTSKITGGTAAYSSGTTQYIWWTVTYTDTVDHIEKTVNQMTGVYSPLINTVLGLTDSYSYSGTSYRYAHVGSAIFGVNKITSNHYANTIYLGSDTFDSWDHSVDCQGTYIQKSFPTKTALVTSGNLAVPYWCVQHDSSGTASNSPDNSTKTNHPHNYITENSSTSSGASCWFSRTDSDDIYYIGGSGTIFFDSSRQTKFADVPNFEIYTDIIGVNSSGSLKADSIYYGGYYTGTFANLTSSGNDFTNEVVYLGIDKGGSSRYTVEVGNGFRGSPYGCTNSNVTYQSGSKTTFENEALVNGKGLVNYSRSSIRRSGTNWWCSAVSIVSFTGVNKASLRTEIANCIKYSSVIQDCFYSTSNNQYSGYKTYLANAMKNLCNVTETYVSYTPYTTYVQNNLLSTSDDNNYSRGGCLNAGGYLWLKQYTAKIFPTSTSGTYTLNSLSETSSSKFRTLDTLSVTKDTYTGYTYLGLSKCSLNKNTQTSDSDSAPAATNAVFSKSSGASLTSSEMALSSSGTNNSTGEVIDTSAGTVNNKHATIQSKYYTYYYLANTYTINYNLDGGTAGTNTPTSATYDVPFAVSPPTKSGYKFVGWTVTSGLNTSTAKYGNT
ncbi:MAG: InlB B-repeat-containing protein, partial [Acutalibacteraceae bacterium]